jgi:hypothetical protein
MNRLQIALGLAGLVFIGFCALAYNRVGLTGFDRVIAEPWGLVTVLDVMLGGVAGSAVIFLTEKDWRVALAWSAPIFLLGHVVSIGWLVVRMIPLYHQK